MRTHSRIGRALSSHGHNCIHPSSHKAHGAASKSCPHISLLPTPAGAASAALLPRPPPLAVRAATAVARCLMTKAAWRAWCRHTSRPWLLVLAFYAASAIGLALTTATYLLSSSIQAVRVGGSFKLALDAGYVVAVAQVGPAYAHQAWIATPHHLGSVGVGIFLMLAVVFMHTSAHDVPWQSYLWFALAAGCIDLCSLLTGTLATFELDRTGEEHSALDLLSIAWTTSVRTARFTDARTDLLAASMLRYQVWACFMERPWRCARALCFGGGSFHSVGGRFCRLSAVSTTPARHHVGIWP